MTVASGPCPACGVVLDSDTGFRHEREPDPYDVSICVRCHAVLHYVPDADTGILNRTVMTAEDIEAMPAEHRSTLETALGMLERHQKRQVRA